MESRVLKVICVTACVIFAACTGLFAAKRSALSVIEGLSSDDAIVRQTSALDAAKHDIREAIPVLIKRLAEEQNMAVKRVVIKSLASFGDERAIEPLLEELGNSHLGVRLDTIQALANFSPRHNIQQAFLSLLTDANPFVRSSASSLVFRVYTADRAPFDLIEELFSDESDVVRYNILESIEGTQDERLMLRAEKLLSDRSSRVRLRAIDILAGFSDKKYTTAIRKFMENEKNILSERLYAAGMLGTLREQSGWKLCLKNMGHETASVRIQACRSLEKIGLSNKDIIQGLMSAAEDENEDVRSSAKSAIDALKK